MPVKLSDFAKRLVKERGLIRKNKGPSIVPVLIVIFTEKSLRTTENPWNQPVLITACQRTGNLFVNRDLTKLYSMGRHYHPDYDWLSRIDVLEIRQPVGVQTSRLLQISAQVNREISYDY